IKSSITTISTVLLSLGPGAVLPLVIWARATRSLVNTTPTNESPLFAGGTKTVPRDSPALLKYSMEVIAAKSTSVNTAPNPLVVAGMSVPCLKKCTSVTLLPRGVNSRGELNVVKITGYVALRSPNSGMGWPLISKLVPGVMKTAPRVVGAVLKVVMGIGKVVAAAPAPPPSQLISRRPLGRGPGVLPLLVDPTALRKASTTVWIAAASIPAAEYATNSCAKSALGFVRRKERAIMSPARITSILLLIVFMIHSFRCDRR